MIARLHLVTRLITFALASWILVVVFWGLATGKNHIETPLVAVWLLIAGIVVQLGLWIAHKVARRK